MIGILYSFAPDTFVQFSSRHYTRGLQVVLLRVCAKYQKFQRISGQTSVSLDTWLKKR